MDIFAYNNLIEHPNYNFLIIDLYFYSQCNFNCEYCYLKHYNYNKHAFMTMQDIDLVFDAICKSPYKKHVCFLGGEPMIYKNIKYAIKKFENQIIDHVEIFTNGSSKNISNINLKENFSYTFSIHPEYFNKKILNNILFCKNNYIKYKAKLMMYPKFKEKLIEIFNILKDNDITVEADYIHNKNGDFCIKEKIIPEIEDKLSYKYLNQNVSLYDVITKKYNDASKQKMFCFQNELTIFPDCIIQPFCNKKNINLKENPDFFKSYSFSLQRCKFKQRCGCFEQIKYILK